MANVVLKNDNVDNITKLWLPDREMCTAQEELRRIEEWKRKSGGVKRPSELGIDSYIYGNPLHKKFYEGRTPPPVPLDSAENLEWYEEQLKRCIFGFEYNGVRITGDHYWMLNFVPFMVAKKGVDGEVTTDFEINFPYFSYQHDYIFKLIEEAHSLGKGFMMMGGRGFGKTYTVLSVIAKTYFLKPESINYISATHSGHADEAFSKIKRMLSAIEKAHPTLKLARLINTKSHVKSGYEVTKDGIKTEEGPMSEIQKIIYGDNPGVTKGSRPDTQLMEEIGDWSGGKGSLKACYAASEGSWRVGSIYKCRVFMIGTGGSVSTDQAKDMFLNPDAYKILAVKDFVKTIGKKHAVFIPSHYLYGGAGWERTGVNNNEWARKHLEAERELKKDDVELLTKFVQEYPFTVDEVFRKSGTNIFHQRNIAKQWTDLQFGSGNIIKPEVGFLEWKRSKSGTILGVEWVVNPSGNIEIIEHPYRGKDGKTKFNDLYVAGIDSVDQGQLDSTTSKNRSSLAMLVKKRTVDGEYFSQTSNIYVAKYIGRSLDVRDDYEESLKLALYYNARVNIEYTKIGIIHYYREKKQWKLFMKRPAIARSNAGSADLEYIKRLREQTLIGTTTTPVVIDHQDGKIKEYTRDFCYQIYFTDLLEQLRDYQREDRTKYDLVVAMGLCEIADEDLMSIPAKESNSPSKELKKFGYYIDHRGVKKFGELPKTDEIRHHVNTTTPYEFRWIDMDGNGRFDERFGEQLNEIET